MARGKRAIRRFILAILVAFAGAIPAGAADLVSIDVTPHDPTIEPGQTQPFVAVGTFSDSTSRPLGSGGISLPATQTVNANPDAQSYALADFDNDGILDVMTGGNQLTFYGGDGTGAFPNRVWAGPWIGTMQAGQFDGDGIMDLALMPADGFIVIELNDGTGHFPTLGQAVDLGVPGDFFTLSVSGPVVADFNGDGHPDVLGSVVSYNGTFTGRTVAYYGPGFTTSAVIPDVVGVQIVAADLNGDGKDDLVLANSPVLNAAQVYLSTGTGFQAAGSFTFGASVLVQVAVADVNGDGPPDLVATTLDLATLDSTVSVRAGDGSGTAFGAVASYPVGDDAGAIGAADLDGDGAVDLTIGRGGLLEYNGLMDVLLNDGVGGFQAPIEVLVEPDTDPKRFAFGDLNGDGRTDVVAYLPFDLVQYARWDVGAMLNVSSEIVAWSSGDPGVATIDAAGVATGVADGTTTITALSSGISGNTSLTVESVDTTPPVVTAPPDVTTEATAIETPVDIGEATAIDDVDGPVPTTSDAPAAFPLGATVVTWSATDAAGNTGMDFQSVTVEDTTPPVLTVPADVSVTVSAVPATVALGTATATDLFEPVTIDNDAPAEFPEGTTIVTWTATDANGNQATGTQTVDVTLEATQPPAAEALDPAGYGVAYADLVPADATLAAYDEQRFVILTGLVEDLAGDPIADVTAAVHGHPEYGTAKTDATGRYTLPVNGGAVLTVDITDPDYLMAQRKVETGWNEINLVDTVTLLSQDTTATTFTFDGNPATHFSHRSETITDARGTRAATLVFSGDTQATVVAADGTQTPVSGPVTVRATEYVRPETMPGLLPPNSRFTYATELALDGVAPDASVQFSQPVILYVDNFLSFPVGEVVPYGTYDRVRGVWVPEDNGVVVQLLDGDLNGTADSLDATGDGIADDLNGDGNFDDEVAGLPAGAEYAPGTTFWRVPVAHFSPGDCNWSGGVPADAVAPPYYPPDEGGEQRADAPDPTEEICAPSGSSVSCESGIHSDDIPLPGVDVALHYKSSRAAGYQVPFTVHVTDGTPLPPSLVGVRAEVTVAGHKTVFNVPALPNQNVTAYWDGTDFLGRTAVGEAKAKVRVIYTYPMEYTSAGLTTLRAFDKTTSSTVIGNSGTSDITQLVRTYRIDVHHSIAPGNIAAGWSLTRHHQYAAGITSRGDGLEQTNGPLVAYTVGGTHTSGFSGDGGPASQAALSSPSDVEVAPDGSVYIADLDNYRVRKVDPSGVITTVAGNGTPGSGGDDGAATSAQLERPEHIALGPDGSLYISGNSRIRRVGTDGTITTVAGTGANGPLVEGVPATDAAFGAVGEIVVSPGGVLYFVDTDSQRILSVETDGRLGWIGGTDSGSSDGDGGLAREASFVGVTDIALDNEGNLLVIDGNGFDVDSVRRIDLDGTISTIAGLGTFTYNWAADGVEAIEADLEYPDAIVPDGQGGYYLNDYWNTGIFHVDSSGIMSNVVGVFGGVSDAEGVPARQTSLNWPSGMAVGPDRTLYYVDRNEHVVRSVGPSSRASRTTQVLGPGLGLAAGEKLVVSTNGSGDGFVFDAEGRHLRTLDLATGVTLRSFGYDGAGQVVSISDRFGNTATIQRDASGPTAIVGPDGDTTAFTVDGSGDLTAVTYADGSGYTFVYTASGRMTQKTTPTGGVSTYAYNASGQVTSAQDPGGGVTQFAIAALNQGDSVTTDPEGRSYSTSRSDEGPDGIVVSQVDKAGLPTLVTGLGDGNTITTERPDGTFEQVVNGNDPVFGTPMQTFRYVQLLSGKSVTTTADVAYADTDLNGVPDRVTRTTTVNGKATTVVDDLLAGSVVATSPLGRTVTSLYDPATLLTTADQVPGRADVNYTYDARGRMTTTTQGTGPDARTTAIVYDAEGRVGRIDDPYLASISFTYDAVGRVTQKTLKDGSVIGYAYDANGNLTSITPPFTPAHVFTYTPVDLEASYTPPAVDAGDPATVYAYNLAHQLTSITRPDGQVVSIGYDAGARRQTVTLSRGTVTYAYDGFGSLASVTAPDGGTLSFTHDGSVPLSETWGGTVTGSVGVTLDADLRVGSRSVNGAQTVAFTYDNDGLLTQAGGLTLSHDADNGFLTGTALGSVTTARTYNPFGEPASEQADVGATGLYAATYTRDKLGRITQKVETVEGVTHTYDYTYDPGGHLERVDQDGVPVEEYLFDANGNRVDSGNVYDAQDRLTATPDATYTYTENGELATKTYIGGDPITYTYDELGNLMQVAYVEDPPIDYVVDGANRRIGKKVDGALVQGFLYGDALNPVAELDGTGAVVARFVYGSKPNVPDYMMKGGATYRIVSDQVGSPRLVVDTTTGAVVQRMDYDAFGNVISDTFPGFQPFGFAGGIWDRDTELVRFGARDYDPAVGRWTAKDPIQFDGGDTNLYGYSLGDPVNFPDVNGQTREDVETAIRVARELNPDLHVPEMYVVPLPGTATGYTLLTRFGPVATFLDTQFLNELTTDGLKDLYTTVLHESIHNTWDLKRQSDPLNEGYVELEAIERTESQMDRFIKKLIEDRGRKCYE